MNAHADREADQEPVPPHYWAGRCPCGASTTVPEADLEHLAGPVAYPQIMHAGHFITTCHHCDATGSILMKRYSPEGRPGPLSWPAPVAMTAMMPCRPKNPLDYTEQYAEVWSRMLEAMIREGETFDPIPDGQISDHQAVCSDCAIPVIITHDRLAEMRRLQDVGSRYKLTCLVCVVQATATGKVVGGLPSGPDTV